MKPATKAHPLAELFPLYPDADLVELANDIKQHGLRDPIITLKGLILDGRNRLAACEKAGVKPRFEEYDGNDALAFVLSKNLRRRHLTESQRGMIATKIANLPKGTNRHTKNLDTEIQVSRNAGDSSENASAGMTQSEAAAALNVSVGTVQKAKVIIENAVAELIELVESGKVAVDAACLLAGLPEAEQRKLVKAGPKAIKERAAEIRKSKKGKTKPGKDETNGTKTGTTTVVHEPGKLPLRQVAGFPAELADVLESCQVITLVDLDAWKSELPRGSEPNPANLIRAVLNGAGVKVEPPQLIFDAHDALVEHLSGKKPSKAKKDEPEEEDDKPPFAALVADMDEVCKEINRLTIRIKTWESDPLSYCINFTSLVTDLNQVRKFIQQQQPTAPCPYCRATGQVLTRTCEGCKGHKYTTQWKAKAGKGSVAS